MRLAIADDLTIQPDGERQSYSELWGARAAERGVAVTRVDGFANDAVERIRRADGFMWRYRFDRPSTDAGPRLCDAVEHGLGIPVWPPARSRRYFEDKARQYMLLAALRLPHPRTWIFWREQDALEALPDLPMPIVAKLSAGVQSRGVALLSDRAAARRHVERMFSFGAGGLKGARSRLGRLTGRREEGVRALWRGGLSRHLNFGCVIFQQFVEDADGDTKVVVQGDRALAVRRLNRPGDFRASGSGCVLYEAAALDPHAIRLAFRFADAFGPAPLAMDIIDAREGCLIGEFSHTTPLYPFRRAEGHWIRRGDTVRHVPARIDLAAQIFDDFLAQLPGGDAAGWD